MLKHSSEKLNLIPKNKRNEHHSRSKFKISRLLSLVSQQKRLFDQSSFTIQMSLGVFQGKISHGNESRNFFILAVLTVISPIFKLKDVKKSQCFSTVHFRCRHISPVPSDQFSHIWAR
jgi:hypothetical protein